jgi:hypothetical protein
MISEDRLSFAAFLKERRQARSRLMPIHDWTGVDADTFHFFHMRWIASICDVLNEGLLPRNCYAMGEQSANGDEPDVLTLCMQRHSSPPAKSTRTLKGLERRTNE